MMSIPHAHISIDLSDWAKIPKFSPSALPSSLECVSKNHALEKEN